MFPEEYELGFYILENDILHSHYSENVRSYIFSISSASLSKEMYTKELKVQTRLVIRNEENIAVYKLVSDTCLGSLNSIQTGK
jgi:hypothetical protein